MEVGLCVNVKWEPVGLKLRTDVGGIKDFHVEQRGA